MVCLPELRRDPEIYRLSQAEELRDFPRHAGNQRPGSAGQTIPARVRQAASAVLQGGDRVRVAAMPGMGGFELLDLHDFPGQGTALVGVLDPFWEEKGYVAAAEYSRFCGPTVPLAILAKRVFTTDETLNATIEISHFGAAPFKAAPTTWTLVADDGSTLASGQFDAKDIPVGNGTALGTVSVALQNVHAPAHCKLLIAVERGLQAALHQPKTAEAA